jgi:hypothetical protein
MFLNLFLILKHPEHFESRIDHFIGMLAVSYGNHTCESMSLEVFETHRAALEVKIAESLIQGKIRWEHQLVNY